MPSGSAVAGGVAWVLGTSPRMTAPWRGRPHARNARGHRHGSRACRPEGTTAGGGAVDHVPTHPHGTSSSRLSRGPRPARCPAPELWGSAPGYPCDNRSRRKNSHNKIIPVPSSRCSLPPSAHRSEIMTSGWCDGGRAGRESSRPGRSVTGWRPIRSVASRHWQPLSGCRRQAPRRQRQGRAGSDAAKLMRDRTSATGLLHTPRPLRRGASLTQCGLPAPRRPPRRGRFTRTGGGAQTQRRNRKAEARAAFRRA